MTGMTNVESKKYENLLRQAGGLLRQDAEGKFNLARILQQMIMLSGSATQVAKDVGLPRARVRNYVAVLEFWGDDRMPDAPQGEHSKPIAVPAGWAPYETLARYTDSRFTGEEVRRLKRIALKHGAHAMWQEFHKLRTAHSEAALAAVGLAGFNEEFTRKQELNYALISMTNAASKVRSFKRLRRDEVELLAAKFDELSEALKAGGVVVPAAPRRRRAA